jgi:gamma-glutamyl-gamma-aminobutyrate hydrolase PuuD
MSLSTHEETVERSTDAAGAAPMIGISTYAEIADWADWPQPVVLAPHNYIDCLVAAGASPVLLPSSTRDHATIGSTLDRLDGLVLIGGDDVCPESYGLPEAPQEHREGRHRPDRDVFEIALARHAWSADMPLLAICRGMQILNVALGGTLIADLFSAGFSHEHRIKRGVFNDHGVAFEPGTIAHELCGAVADVPSHHHQAIDRLADGLVVAGRSADGVIEAVEARTHSFVVGVQWHPEEGVDMALFEALVSAAAR